MVVWQDGYRCFGKCDTAGDVFDWLIQFRQLKFTEALEQMGTKRASSFVPTFPKPTLSTEPPASNWQNQARKVVEQKVDSDSS